MKQVAIMHDIWKKTYPALIHRDFRCFWLGQSVSLIGTWMQATAQQWLVYSLTKSAFLLGLLGVAQFGPMLLLSLVAGVFIDRYPKKRLLLATQFLLMFQAFLLAGLVWTEQVTYGHVLALAFLLGMVNTVDQPARQSFVPELVAAEHIRNAVNLNSAIVNVARMVGPALAAYCMAEFGAGMAFFLNGLSFIPVLLGISSISTRTLENRPRPQKIHREIWEGLEYVSRLAQLRVSILAMLAVSTFVMNYNVFAPLYADHILNAGVQGYGFVSSAIGVGALIGAVGVASFAQGRPTLKLLISSGLTVSGTLIILGQINSLGLAVAVCIFLGFFHILFITTANSLVQINAEGQYRGRVMSIYTLAFMGTTPIGNIFVGSVIEQVGTAHGMVICGFSSIVLLFMAALNHKRRG